MLLFPMNVLLECLMLIKLILAKVTTQMQEDKLWTVGEECLFSLHTHYLSFITQWKHYFFPPMSLILLAPGNNVSFYSVTLATNGSMVPYNGKMVLLEKNINKKNINKIKLRRTFAQLLAMPHWYILPLVDNKQPTPGMWRAGQGHTTTGWWLLLLAGWPSPNTAFPALQMKTSQNVLCETAAKMKQYSHCWEMLHSL